MMHKGGYGRYVHNMITAGDLVVMNLAYLITFALLGRFTEQPLREVWLAINVAYIPVMLIFSRQHKLRALYSQLLMRNALLATVLHLVCFYILFSVVSQVSLPLDYYLVYYPVAAVLLALWWVTTRKVLARFRKKGRNFSRFIIVGTGPTAMSLYREMMGDAGYGYKFFGFFSDDPMEGIPEGSYRGRIADLSDFIGENEIDEVYYTISGEKPEVMREVVNATENHVARFYYVPQINRYVTRGFELHSIGSVPVLTLMNQPLESLWNRGVKRAFDLLFSTVALACCPIIFIPVAIAIKISSPGPVFFKQLRTGYKGRDFYCWKFRTMRVNADADSRQASRDDPRKTRVGDFLRRTSLDELPQFINVWLGSMSIVGPRPHMLKHTEEYSRLIDQYMVRHYIKPGITGWAQVSGYRGQTDELWKMEKRVECDVWYIQNWSFLLDMKIILKTLTNAFHGEKNAF